MNIRKWMISLFAIPLASTVLAMEPTLYPLDINGDGKPYDAGPNFLNGIPRISGDDIYYVRTGDVEGSSTTKQYSLVKYNTNSKTTNISPWITSIDLDVEPANDNSDKIFFTYKGEINDTFKTKGVYTYNFSTQKFLKAEWDVNAVYGVSDNGNYILYTFDGNDYIKNLETSEDILITNENDEGYAIGKTTSVTNSGEILREFRRSTKLRYSIFDSKNKEWNSLDSYIPSDSSINFFGLTHAISPNGNYVTGYSDEGDLHYTVLIDRKNKKVYKHKLEAKRIGGFAFEHTVTDNGIASFNLILTTDLKDDSQLIKLAYTYDFINQKELMKSKTTGLIDPDTREVQFVMAHSAENQRSIVYKREEGNQNLHVFWTKFSTDTANKIVLKVTPESLTVDPYENSTTTLKLNTEGSVFAADVSCNVVGPASITQAEYGAWGSENRFEIPMTVNDKAWQGALSQKAPALAVDTPSTFSNWTLLADVTTADVNITCNVVASDSNGQKINMTVENATIRLDDKIHGGEATITGQIDIPGLTDLSGVEVIVTINGRTVKLLTDKDGKFSFEGLRDGEFTVSFKSPNHVQACQQTVIKEGGSVNLGKIELLAGDINNDGIIDILDFTYLAARYRSKVGETDYDVKADLNRDDIINIQDLAILGSHFGSTQCGKEL